MDVRIVFSFFICYYFKKDRYLSYPYRIGGILGYYYLTIFEKAVFIIIRSITFKIAYNLISTEAL